MTAKSRPRSPSQLYSKEQLLGTLKVWVETTLVRGWGISEDGLKLTVISPTLHSVSASFGTSSARIRDNRITSLFERWKMGL